MPFEPPPTSYQEIPYANDPYRSSHPDHLATVAILSGLAPPPVESCRVLELGCARGGNLIPMAVAMPGARFIGIDSSPRQTAEARELIERLGLPNISVIECDILELDGSLGPFDYIICHGTFSWVLRQVQDKILDVFAASLAANGLAYISYNTYPGWHFRGLAREMMCYHARRFEQPADRAREARTLLQFMTKSALAVEPVYSNLLKQELDYVTARSDAYLLHDHLEVVNEPIYFHDLIERAGSRGLEFVSEVQSTLVPRESLPSEVANGLRELSRDDIELEQFMDFVINRRFRQSVFCRSGLEQRRAGPDGLEKLYVAARGTGDHSPAASRDGPLVKAALEHLHEIWPLSLPFEALLQAACTRMEKPTELESPGLNAETGELKLGLIRGYCEKRVELATLPPSFVVDISDKPVASPLARMQAQAGRTVTNLRHEAGELNDFGREVVVLLDGRFDRAAIVGKLIPLVENGLIKLTRNIPGAGPEPSGRAGSLGQAVEDSLDHCLKKLAKFALLVA